MHTSPDDASLPIATDCMQPTRMHELFGVSEREWGGGGSFE